MLEARVKPGYVLGGTYRVERVLGRGGMGMVVAATDLRTDRLCAVKFMLLKALQVFDNAMQRFVREGRALAELRSDNIAQVLEVGTLDEGWPFIAMEYLQGADLSQVMTARASLSVEDATEFVRQACAGMEAAHAHGLVHRDLKPANLFLTRSQTGAPLVKVIDFGISKWSDERAKDGMALTSTHGTMGSPLFMSPEQCRSAKNVDHRSDVWSLGVILYHLLSDRLPFEAESNAEVLAHLLTNEPQPLEAHVPWLPPALAAIVSKCLQRDPAERYQNARELADALAPFARASSDRQSLTALVSDYEGSPRRLDVTAFLSDYIGREDEFVKTSVYQPTPDSTYAATSSRGSEGEARRRWALIGLVCVAAIALVAFLLWPDGSTHSTGAEATAGSNADEPAIGANTGANTEGEPTPTGNQGAHATGIDSSAADTRRPTSRPPKRPRKPRKPGKPKRPPKKTDKKPDKRPDNKIPYDPFDDID